MSELKEQKVKLFVRYSEGFGRGGDLSESFVCTTKQLEALKSYGGLGWSEQLGKHSEGTYSFNDKTLTVLTDDQNFINKAIEYGLVNLDMPFVYEIVERLAERYSEEDDDFTGENWNPEDKEIYLALGGYF